MLLPVSSLDLSVEEILVLDHMYRDHKASEECNYVIVWLPIVDRSIAWDDGYQQKFEQLQAMMPWYTNSFIKTNVYKLMWYEEIS